MVVILKVRMHNHNPMITPGYHSSNVVNIVLEGGDICSGHYDHYYRRRRGIFMMWGKKYCYKCDEMDGSNLETKI